MSPSFDDLLLRDGPTGFVLDLSAAPTDEGLDITAALSAMERLEAGAIANPDEGRMVGHYWLRAPELAPEVRLRDQIEAAIRATEALDPGDHTDVLLIGIGGSALGPLLLADCLARPSDPRRLHLMDNTDPEGIHRTLAALDPRRTLTLVVSKSGRTPETVNGWIAAEGWYVAAGERLADHAVAITGEGSHLDRVAREQGWRARLPVWDWVGGRTSITGPVGLAPMALCGWDHRGLLEGAAAMDALGRRPWQENPAARLAMSWYAAGAGRGDRALVILPYRDRFQLLGRYLQQLVMESLGKRLDRAGRVVHQGLAVYGNKGSTDQHAFVQQVRDGRDDSFVHFIETTTHHPRLPVEEGMDASDHLVGLLYGTRRALALAERPSVVLRVPDASARSLGMLIALFERAVGIYGELIDVNAYNQPGVEAGKEAARAALELLQGLRDRLDPTPRGAVDLSRGADPLLIWRLLDHLAAAGEATRHPGGRPAEDRFSRP